jgi:transcriptional regulator with XRE-family HTH domain
MELGDQLRQARIATGKTQEEVAKDAGMHVTQYNGYERGRSRPAPETLKRIAHALDISIGSLGSPPAMGSGTPSTSSFDGLRDAFRREVASVLGVPYERISVRVELH